MNKKQLVIKKLHQNNISDVLNLQQRIVDGLHPDEKHFILNRTQEDYMKYLNKENSSMVGIFDKDKLIAQAVYCTPNSGEQREMPEFRPDIPNEELVIYEAILVDPTYRGSSLMKQMLSYIETNAIDAQRTHSIIQIAIDNPASWINALHHGMSITKVDKDPVDDVKVIYLEKDIKSAHAFKLPPKDVYSMFLGDNIHKKIPSLFNKMQYIINEGYKGAQFNKATQSLVWIKEDQSNVMALVLSQKLLSRA